MRYLSTRDEGRGAASSLSEAILRGVAADGGLFMPESIPQLAPSGSTSQSLHVLAAQGLAGYFEGDALAPDLHDITRDALNFGIPVSSLDEGPHMLELFHGPTAAFKDVGARFLAACMARLADGKKKRTVLVATSGDTGGAVASAFYNRPGFDVIILYPEGRVSPLQAHQLGCWGANVRAFSVAGSFDDCQRTVKEAFANRDLCETLGLTSANSINIGRLLPQIVYYLHAAATIGGSGAPGFIIPSGNLGNVTACVLAKRMGANIGPVVMAFNANRTVPDFFETGEWRPRPSVSTLASAMDVGDPSNMERLREIFSDDTQMRQALRAISVNDSEIGATVTRAYARWGKTWCPHTAAGLYAYEALREEEKRERPWVVAATAHAAKFSEVVEPLVGAGLEMPVALARLLDRPAGGVPIGADLQSLMSELNV